jgi:hypothetical protein
MKAWAVAKILLIAFSILLLMVLILDNLAWADRCERFGGIIYQQSIFSAQTCIPNLNLEQTNDN